MLLIKLRELWVQCAGIPCVVNSCNTLARSQSLNWQYNTCVSVITVVTAMSSLCNHCLDKTLNNVLTKVDLFHCGFQYNCLLGTRCATIIESLHKMHSFSQHLKQLAALFFKSVNGRRNHDFLQRIFDSFWFFANDTLMEKLVKTKKTQWICDYEWSNHYVALLLFLALWGYPLFLPLVPSWRLSHKKR